MARPASSSGTPVGSSLLAVRQRRDGSTNLSVRGAQPAFDTDVFCSTTNPWDNDSAFEGSAVRTFTQVDAEQRNHTVTDMERDKRNNLSMSLHHLRAAALRAIMQRELSLTQLDSACKAFVEQHGRFHTARSHSSSKGGPRKNNHLMRSSIEKLIMMLQNQTINVVQRVERWQTARMEFLQQHTAGATAVSPHLPPFMWQGTNYLLRLAVDTSSLLSRYNIPCQHWLGISLSGNPCLLSDGLLQRHELLHPDYAIFALSSLPHMLTSPSTTAPYLSGGAQLQMFTRAPFPLTPSTPATPLRDHTMKHPSSRSATRVCQKSSAAIDTAAFEFTAKEQEPRGGRERSKLDEDRKLIERAASDSKRSSSARTGSGDGLTAQRSSSSALEQRHRSVFQLSARDISLLLFAHAHVVRAVGEAVDTMVQAANRVETGEISQQVRITDRSLHACTSARPITTGTLSSGRSRGHQFEPCVTHSLLACKDCQQRTTHAVGAHAAIASSRTSRQGRPATVVTAPSVRQDIGDTRNSTRTAAARPGTSPGRLLNRVEPSSLPEADGDSIYTTDHHPERRALLTRPSLPGGEATEASQPFEGSWAIEDIDEPIAGRLRQLREKLAQPPRLTSPSERRDYYLSLLGLSAGTPDNGPPQHAAAPRINSGSANEIGLRSVSTVLLDSAASGLATEVRVQVTDLTQTLDAAAENLAADLVSVSPSRVARGDLHAHAATPVVCAPDSTSDARADATMTDMLDSGAYYDATAVSSSSGIRRLTRLGDAEGEFRVYANDSGTSQLELAEGLSLLETPVPKAPASAPLAHATAECAPCVSHAIGKEMDTCPGSLNYLVPPSVEAPESRSATGELYQSGEGAEQSVRTSQLVSSGADGGMACDATPVSVHRPATIEATVASDATSSSQHGGLLDEHAVAARCPPKVVHVTATAAQANAAASAIQRLSRTQLAKVKVAGLRRLRHLTSRVLQLVTGLSPARMQALAAVLRRLEESGRDYTSSSLPYMSLHSAALRPIHLLGKAILLLVQPGSWRIDGVPLPPRVYSDGLAALEATASVAWTDSDLDGWDIPLRTEWLDVSTLVEHRRADREPVSPLNPALNSVPKVVAALTGIPTCLSPALMADVFEAEGGAWVYDRLRRLCTEVVGPSKCLMLSPPSVLAAASCLSDASLTSLTGALSTCAPGSEGMTTAVSQEQLTATDTTLRQNLLPLFTWGSIVMRIVELSPSCAPENFQFDCRNRLSRLVAQDNGIADVAAASRMAKSGISRSLAPLLGRLAIVIINCDVPMRTARALADILVNGESAPVQAMAPPVSLIDVDTRIPYSLLRERAGLQGTSTGDGVLSFAGTRPTRKLVSSETGRPTRVAHSTLETAANSVDRQATGYNRVDDGCSTDVSALSEKRLLHRAVAAALSGRSPIIRSCLSSGASSRARTLSMIRAISHQLEHIAGTDVHLVVVGGGFTLLDDTASTAAAAQASVEDVGGRTDATVGDLRFLGMPSDQCLATVSPSKAADDALLLHSPSSLAAARLLMPNDWFSDSPGPSRPWTANAVLATIDHPLDYFGCSIAAAVLALQSVNRMLHSAVARPMWEAWSGVAPHVPADAVRRHMRMQQGATAFGFGGNGIGAGGANNDTKILRPSASTGMLSVLSAPGVSAGASYTSGPEFPSASGHGLPDLPVLAKSLSNDSNLRVDLSQTPQMAAASPSLSVAGKGQHLRHGDTGARALVDGDVCEVDDADEPIDDDHEEDVIDVLREVAAMVDGADELATSAMAAGGLNRRAQAAATAFGPRLEVGVLSTADVQSAARLGCATDAMSLACMNRVALIAAAIGAAGMTHTPLSSTADVAEQSLTLANLVTSQHPPPLNDVLPLHPIDAALRATAGISLRAAASSCIGVGVGAASCSSTSSEQARMGLGVDGANLGTAGTWTNAGVASSAEDPMTATSYSLSQDLAQFATRLPPDPNGPRADVYHVAVLLSALLSSAGSSAAGAAAASAEAKAVRRNSVGGAVGSTTPVEIRPEMPTRTLKGTHGYDGSASASAITPTAAWELARRLLMLPPGRLSRRLSAAVPVLTANAVAVLDKVKAWSSALDLSWSSAAAGACPLRPAPLTRLRPGPTTAARLTGCSPGLTLLAHWCSAVIAHLACVCAQGGPAQRLRIGALCDTAQVATTGLDSLMPSVRFNHVVHVSDNLLVGAKAPLATFPGHQVPLASAPGTLGLVGGRSSAQRRASVSGALSGPSANRSTYSHADTEESMLRDLRTLLGLHPMDGPDSGCTGSGGRTAATPEAMQTGTPVPLSCSRGIAGILMNRDRSSVAVGPSQVAAHVQAALCAASHDSCTRLACAVVSLPVTLSMDTELLVPDEYTSTLPTALVACVFDFGASSEASGTSRSVLVCLLAAEPSVTLQDSTLAPTLASSLRLMANVSPLYAMFGGGPYLVPRWVSLPADDYTAIADNASGRLPDHAASKRRMHDLTQRLSIRVSAAGIVALDPRAQAVAVAHPLRVLEEHVSVHCSKP